MMPPFTIVKALLICAAFSFQQAPGILPEPANDLPTNVNRSWQTLESTEWPDLADRGMQLTMEMQSVRQARVDSFIRVNGSWRWSSTHRYRPGKQWMPQASYDGLGVLLRSPDRPGAYAWGECNLADESCQLRWYRTISLETSIPDAEAMLLAGDQPRRLRPPVGVSVAFVPLRGGVVCAHNDTVATCGILSADSNVVLNGPPRPLAELRILRLHDECGSLKPSIWAPGRSSIRPTALPLTISCADRWAVVSGDWAKRESVIDFESSRFALVRLPVESLPLIPDYADVPADDRKGLVLLPVIGERRIAPEPGATVYAFDTRDYPSAVQVLLAKTVVDESGRAAFASLGSGKYFFKLISALSSRRPVTAQLQAGAAAEVRFPIGLVVRGSIRMIAPGSGTTAPNTAPVVRVSPVVDFAHSEKLAGDMTDLIVMIPAREDGTFSMALTTRGVYQLTVEWGTASAVRQFEVKDEESEVDLGEIALTTGSILKGYVRGCVASHLTVASVPDAKQVTPGQYRKIPVAADGSFTAEGLRSGLWMVMAMCPEGRSAVVPESFLSRDGLPAFVDFEVRR
jgi:hypothetical protein